MKGLAFIELYLRAVFGQSVELRGSTQPRKAPELVKQLDRRAEKQGRAIKEQYKMTMWQKMQTNRPARAEK